MRFVGKGEAATLIENYARAGKPERHSLAAGKGHAFAYGRADARHGTMAGAARAARTRRLRPDAPGQLLRRRRGDGTRTQRTGRGRPDATDTRPHERGTLLMVGEGAHLQRPGMDTRTALRGGERHT